MRIIGGYEVARNHARGLARHFGCLYRVFSDTNGCWNVERYVHDRERRMPAGEYYGPGKDGSGTIVLRGTVADDGGVTIGGANE